MTKYFQVKFNVGSKLQGCRCQPILTESLNAHKAVTDARAKLEQQFGRVIARSAIPVDVEYVGPRH